MCVVCLFLVHFNHRKSYFLIQPCLATLIASHSLTAKSVRWILVYEMRTIVFFHKHADTLKKMLHIQTVHKRSAYASWCGFWGGGGGCCFFKPAKLIWLRSSDCYDSWLCPEARPLWSVLMIIMLNWRLEISKEITVVVKKNAFIYLEK